ncbi:MAG: hypothetical protein IJ851_05250 [Eubacterium sp.]|nr:hypothetical protein [Eubacterium sp.]
MSKENNTRAKNLMYEQQIDFIEYFEINKFVELVENKLKPKKYALIIHDKDFNDKGEQVKPHLHLMLSFENARSLNSIAKLLNDKTQQITVWRGNSNNGYAYLTHRTDEAKNKYQYEPEKVISNFDYSEFLKSISKEVENKDNCKINALLDMLYTGQITKQDVEKQLTGSKYARYHKQIEIVYNKRLQNLASEFRKKLKDENKAVNVIWIFGCSGTGKTTLAKNYAEKNNKEYFVSGSSKDIFQNYSGEHTLILDELRANVIPYQDLLKITDPYSIGANLPARYFDKGLACDTIIITSPYNPYDFYLKSVSKDDRNIDTFEQLSRRIMLTIEMTYSEIKAVSFNTYSLKYETEPGSEHNNTFSKYNYKDKTADIVQLYYDIVAA